MITEMRAWRKQRMVSVKAPCRGSMTRGWTGKETEKTYIWRWMRIQFFEDLRCLNFILNGLGELILK